LKERRRRNLDKVPGKGALILIGFAKPEGFFKRSETLEGEIK